MAPSAVPSTLAEVDDELDVLALRILELSQDLVTAKLHLERLTRDGFFLLAKSRYSQGVSAVSALQIPAGGGESDSPVEANVRVTRTECLRGGDCHVRFNYFSATHSQSFMSEEGDETCNAQSGNRRQAKPDIDEISPRAKQDPLKWFGVLVPQTLRQSSTCFTRSLDVVLEVANLQSEIHGVLARHKYLQRVRAKLETKSE